MLYSHFQRPHPPQPAPSQGFLMQKIIACEKRSIPCLCTDLCLDACDLTAIRSIAAPASMPCMAVDGCTLRIALPLNVCACDACGHCRTLPASIDVETDLSRSFLCGLDDPRNTLLILPCVRLLRAEGTGSGCFCVQLAVSLDIYLLRYEVCHCGAPKPQCPPLPLYPKPMC